MDEVEEAKATVLDRVQTGLAKKFGMSLEEIKNVEIALSGIKDKVRGLSAKICVRMPQLTTKEEFQKAFDNLADAFVEERIRYLDAVDAMEDLPQDVKKDIKTQLLITGKVKDIRLDYLMDEARKIAPLLGCVEDALRGGHAPEQVFIVMRPVSTAIRASVDAMLAGKEDVGPDDRDAPTTILTQMAITMRPEMAGLLEAFYAREGVKDALKARFRADDPAWHSMAFECFSSDPEINTDGARITNVKQLFAE